MSLAGRCAGWSFLLATLPLSAQPLFAQHGAAPAPAKPEAHRSAPRDSGARLTDAQASDLAKEALGAEDPASIKAALTRLKGHTFKSSKVPERELVLYAQGLL